MESDVPLIEIGREDDSLLQLPPNDGVSSSNTNKNTNDDTYFFCSPLQPPRSKPVEGVMVNVDSEKPNKENTSTNTNKVEEQKLMLQPQQMKRKKKWGGYNLRKSLAWDRAFFTDEGVLNSEELSMISGNMSSSGSLSVIHEDTNCITDSADVQAPEEKLFKVLPETPSNKARVVGGSSLPKHDSPAKDNLAPGSAARRKVLSACDINRSGSKRSGCPRPVASSSLKRPANVNTMKSPSKEKVSKLPIPKPDPCLLSRTSKNVTVGADDVKRSQIAHPAVKLNNTKTGPINAKVTPTGKSLTSKSSVRQAKRNVASLVKGSPTKIPCPPTIEANNGLDVISKQALPASRHASYRHGDKSRKAIAPQVISKQELRSTGHASYDHNDRSKKTAVPEGISKRSKKTAVPEGILKQARPSKSHASYGCDDRSRKTSVPLPCIGVNMLSTQLPTPKPSGLRMPSPSLGFFHQPKASSLPSPLKTSSQPCIVPNPRQVGSVDPVHESRLPSSLGKKLNVMNDDTTMGSINVQCSSSGCSVSSTVSPTPKDKVEPFSQVSNVQKVELKVQSSTNCYDQTENQKKLDSTSVHEDQRSLVQAEPYIAEKVSHLEEVEFQSNEDKYLLQWGSGVQFDKDENSMKAKSKDTDIPHVTSHLRSAVKFPGFSGKNDITENQLFEDTPHDFPKKNSVVVLKSKSEDASSSSSILISDDPSRSNHNVNVLHAEQADFCKSLTCDGNQICDEDEMIWEYTGSFTEERQASEEIRNYSCVNVSDVNPKVQNYSTNELKRSDALSDCRFEDQAKDDGRTFDTMSRNSHVEAAQMLVVGGKLTDEMNQQDLGISAPDNCQLVMINCGNEKPEQLGLPNSQYIRDGDFQENRWHLNDCVLDGFSISPEESWQKYALHSVDSKEPERTGACSSELEVPTTLSLILPAMLDSRSNVAEVVESLNVDNIASVSEDNKTVVENYNLDSHLRNDFQLDCQDSSLELDCMDEEQMTGAVTSCNINATFSESGDFTSQLNLEVQVEGRSALKDAIQPKDCKLSVENCCRVPQLQPEDDKSYCHQDTSAEHINVKRDEVNFSGEEINVTSGKINVGRHNVEQAKLVMATEDRILNRSSELHDHSFEGSESFEQCHTYHNGNCADISSKLNTSCMEFEETGNEVVLNDYDACGSESKSSKVAPAMLDGRPDWEEMSDYLQMEVAVTNSLKIEPSLENLRSCTKSSHDIKLSNEATSVESDSFAKTTNEENSVSTLAFNSEGGELCSSVISDHQRSSSGSLLQDNELNLQSRKTLADEAEIHSLKNNCTHKSEFQHELEDTLYTTEEMESTKELKKPGSGRKPDVPGIKPPSNAVPFSDEWLAALEAAGEEILTKKSGAVQNSPPHKPEPQLGPWSPVKRKTNQVIGPFDCTKHTNNPPSSQ